MSKRRSRLCVASRAKHRRNASVPKAANALRKLLARRLFDGRLHLRLHQPAGALGEQRLQRYAVDDVERVDDVALGLGHLLAVVIANQSVHVDFAKRHLAGELQAHHDHAGDPEENDVESRDQHRGRIVGLRARVFSRPALGGERPQRRGEPGIQHVIVLTQRHRWIDAVRGAGLGFVCARRTSGRRRRTTPVCDVPTTTDG